VDAAKDNEKVITETEAEYLPEEMKGMTAEQRKAYISKKSDDRKKVQAEIQVLNEKRKQYIATQTPATAHSSLDGAMINTIKERAKTKNLRWE
jgi:hypothetical protein